MSQASQGTKRRKAPQSTSEGRAPHYLDDAAEVLDLLRPLSASDRSVILNIVLAVAQAASDHGDDAAEALLDRLEDALTSTL